VFRAQADWTFILASELPKKELRHLPRKMPLQAYQTSQYVVPRGGIFLGKRHRTFAGSSDSKINIQLACSLNTLYSTAVPRLTFVGEKNTPTAKTVVCKTMALWEIGG
jgi:hypothetical protein